VTALASGNKLVHGQQGEVKGPATFESRLESVKGKGVCVLFSGNKGGVDCFLTSVPRLYPASSRLHAASAATPPPAPHTRTLTAAHAPGAFPRQPLPLLCRGAPALTA
jgi:hypothetical protein